MTLFLITGSSGAGKTSLTQSMIKQGTLGECVSHTTRDMRSGEVDGENYYFTNNKDFEGLLNNNAFVEHVKYDDNYYGLSEDEIVHTLNSNKYAFAIVEYEGYQQIKKQYPDAVGIFMYMTKEDCMANMLLRGDSLEKAEKRIRKYDEEMKNRHDYDYVVKNVREKQESTKNILKYIFRQHS